MFTYQNTISHCLFSFKIVQNQLPFTNIFCSLFKIGKKQFFVHFLKIVQKQVLFTDPFMFTFKIVQDQFLFADPFFVHYFKIAQKQSPFINLLFHFKIVQKQFPFIAIFCSLFKAVPKKLFMFTSLKLFKNSFCSQAFLVHFLKIVQK